jgi:hypothetical protein
MSKNDALLQETTLQKHLKVIQILQFFHKKFCEFGLSFLLIKENQQENELFYFDEYNIFSKYTFFI